MKTEVDITQHGMDYIRKTLSQYLETNKIPESNIGRTIIHMYPVEDTYTKDGELNGYMDAIFCNYHIYNINDMTVFKTQRLHDALHLKVPCEVKVFKDLSTMIVIDEPVMFNFLTDVWIYKFT
jgi:hypothetical protein